ncbi:MAG: ArsR family transcriptional regulator [Thermoplasmata archaeon]|nr:MAG: ArsR family transcriptional regulator [Thermoplasmata archaeon]HEC86860.1 ArsR family transcriptional regulator [Thermoplasmatales archaeon]
MKQKQFKLSKEDRKAAQLLAKLGMPKNLAKTLMYLSHVGECYSVDIEQGTDLKQPQVSIAMRELLKRKWVDEEINRAKTKGRPRHLYRIKTDLYDIMKDLEERKLREIENIKRDLSELKNLLAQRENF